MLLHQQHAFRLKQHSPLSTEDIDGRGISQLTSLVDTIMRMLCSFEYPGTSQLFIRSIQTAYTAFGVELPRRQEYLEKRSLPP